MECVVRFAAAVAFAATVFGGIEAGAAVRPVANPTVRGLNEPKLLSAYERKVLQLEYAKLVKTVRAERARAAEDPSLQPLKDALAAARASEGPDGTNAVAAARALSDAVETVLYSFDGVPEKIKRLQEVGNFLEYDHTLRREQRAAGRLGRPKPASATVRKPDAGSESAESGADAADDEDAPPQDAEEE